ncbi:dTDP-fucopyranose mutase, partial [Oleoguttula sp. CCFEE 5521]
MAKPPALANMASNVEDMTDEQMETLLAEATTRLKQKERSKAAPKYNYTFPKLDAGKAQEPYIVSNGNAVEANSSRLSEEKLHNDKYGIRKVEDPVAVRKLAIE